ncbi:MAG: hypothetical protein LBC83_04370 [Oscillospiraceae bacterium]|nr:hypothetical protein [Oscillospiraceae bacterium]
MDKAFCVTKRTGFVLYEKGSGSAYEGKPDKGGDWQPSKEDDGSYTDHDNPWAHSDPHDHPIDWSKGYPGFGKPINYPDGDAPDFDGYDFDFSKRKAAATMPYTPDMHRFHTLEEFKQSMKCGAEVQLLYREKSYTIFPTYPGFNIGEGYRLIDDKPYNVGDGALVPDIYGSNYDTIDQLLDHEIEGTKLRDIITQVEVTDRTI